LVKERRFIVAVASVKQRPLNLVVCGHGRIGGALLEKLGVQELPVSVWRARIDPEQGLYCQEATLPAQIDLLIICISAGQKSKPSTRWQWRQIFAGLTRQLHSGAVTVKNIVMVSSTRVYEAIEQGIVTAHTSASSCSEQGKGLVIAEQELMALPAQVRILRASGLYGVGYPVYRPILKAGLTKPRFGVDSAEVVARLYQSVVAAIDGRFCGQIEVLTDGGVYFEGECFYWPEDRPRIEVLAKQYRILLNSTAITL